MPIRSRYWRGWKPYVDGRVGMWGTSYGAHTQADAAKLNPPSLAAMVLISPFWALGSIVAMVGLHHYISRKEILATWGDVQSGAAFERARLNLLRLEEEKYHPKNWRPRLSGSCVCRKGEAYLWTAGGASSPHSSPSTSYIQATELS